MAGREPNDIARAAFGLDVIRVAVAGLILIHGVKRIVIGGVEARGGWLSSQGFAFGGRASLGGDDLGIDRADTYSRSDAS